MNEPQPELQQNLGKVKTGMAAFYGSIYNAKCHINETQLNY